VHRVGAGAVGHATQGDAALGEGAGLVEAQHVHPTQCLDGGGVADQRAACRQPASGGQFRHGGDKRQAFGYRRDGEANRPAQRLHKRTAAKQVHRDQRRAGRDGQRQYPGGQRAQSHFHPGQRRVPVMQPRGPAGLGARPRRHHYRDSVTGGHDRPLVEHAVPLGQVRGDRGRSGLCHHCGLAGQAGLVDLQAAGADDPAVRRHGVTGMELDQVTCHQLIGSHHNLASLTIVAPDPHGRGAGLAQLTQRAVGAEPLRTSDQRVEPSTVEIMRASSAEPVLAEMPAPAARAGVSGLASSSSDA
jgi:hypothetical protein